MPLHLDSRVGVCLGLAVLACLRSAPLLAADWKPVAREELTMEAPIVEKNADAEALFWDVRIRDEFAGGVPRTVRDQYVRIKIFTDKGREQNATVDIPYISGTSVSQIEARTLKRDGRIVELNRRDVRERTIVKVSGLKLKAFSFAVPDLGRGDIVEYRWHEVEEESLASHLRLPFWREIPCLEVNYYLKPLEFPGFTMRWQPFNGSFTHPVPQPDGYNLVSLSHVPAYPDAPYAPPEYEVKPWVFIYYSEGEPPKTADQFWKRFAKEVDGEFDKAVKVDDDVRAIATGAVAGVMDEDGKIQALLDAVRTRVKRVDMDTARDADRRAAKANRNSAETLKRGYGTGRDVTAAFIALAKAAGLDAHPAAVPRRDDIFFRGGHLNAYFLPDRIAAVRRGTSWKLVDPANQYAHNGSLRWRHELQQAVISDNGTSMMVDTTAAPPVASTKRRVATLKLLEDGTLEGQMGWTFSGHWSQTFKEQEDGEAPADLEKALRGVLAERLPGAEITDVKIENVTDPNLPYKNSWRVRIPGFAQRTGSRLFISPAVFQRDLPPTFPASTRESDIYFRFAWHEDDYVTIDLPEGFALEAPESLAPLDAGFATYATTLGTNAQGRQLVFRRRMTVGHKDAVLVSKEHYSGVKRFFDLVQEADAHTLALKRQETNTQ